MKKNPYIKTMATYNFSHNYAVINIILIVDGNIKNKCQHKIYWKRVGNWTYVEQPLKSFHVPSLELENWMGNANDAYVACLRLLCVYIVEELDNKS